LVRRKPPAESANCESAGGLRGFAANPPYGLLGLPPQCDEL